MEKKLIIITFLMISTFLTGCLKQEADLQKSDLQEKPDQSEQQVQEKKLPIEEITKDWQEYISDQYGYRIKFPSDWQEHKTYPNPNISSDMVFSSISEDQREEQAYAIFSISIEEAKDRNLANYNLIDDLVKDSYKKSTLEISNNQSVLLITIDDNKDQGNIIILRDGYFYRLTWNATTIETRRLYEEIFKKILATFKFTHQPEIKQNWI